MANEKRLIDAIGLVVKLAKRIGPMIISNRPAADIYRVMLSCIADAPTVEAVEVRHGAWEYGKWEQGHWVKGNERCRCTVCGRDFAVDNQNIWNGCPHCLAKMDRERSESGDF